VPENETPTASPDRAERREMNRGYREQSWGGHPHYVCLREPCWYGTYRRANTFDEAEMQAHQASAHATQ
jgi:hypothetical protein